MRGMRQSTPKSLWAAIKDLLSTILSSLYTERIDSTVKLDIKLECEDVEVYDEEEYLGI